MLTKAEIYQSNPHHSSTVLLQSVLLILCCQYVWGKKVIVQMILFTLKKNATERLRFRCIATCME